MREIQGALKRMKRLEAPSEVAARGFVARATIERMVDVAYASIDSPFGALLAAVTTRGLVTLSYPDHPVDEVLHDLSAKISPRVLEVPGCTDEVRRQLDRYFEGRLRQFDLPIDWRLSTGFTRHVLQQTSKVPFGQLSTYRDVAAKAGSPRASRAAGNALGSNPIPIVVPCHRIVRSNGDLGGYTGGLDRKRLLLRIEGLEFP